MSEPFASDGVALVRRNRWIAGATAGLLAFGAGAVALAFTGGALDILDPALGAAAMGVMATLYAWVENPRPQEVEGKVRAEAGGVSFNGASLLSRTAIERGFIVLREGQLPYVKLTRRRPFSPLLLRVRDEAEGRRLLDALGFGPAEVEVELRLPSPAAASPFSRALMAGGAIGLSFVGEAVARRLAPDSQTLSIALRVLPFLAGALFLMLSRMVVHLGARAMRVAWLGSERLIPYGEIRSVSRYDNEERRNNPWMGLEVQMSSGEEVRIPIAPLLGWGGLGIQTVEPRLREAMRAYARSDRP